MKGIRLYILCNAPDISNFLVQSNHCTPFPFYALNTVNNILSKLKCISSKVTLLSLIESKLLDMKGNIHFFVMSLILKNGTFLIHVLHFVPFKANFV